MRNEELAVARQLKPWIVAVLAACGLIAIAYLPPRGDREQRYRQEVFMSQLAQQSPARRREQELAEKWRTAQAALRLVEERRRFPANPTGPSLLLAGDADATVRSRLAVELDNVWKALGLSETKVAVGFVIDYGITTPESRLPREEGWAAAYLLPDSIDRTMCIVRTPVSNSYWRRILLKQASRAESEQVHMWLRSNLGPCAFFAAFGAPGRTVRRWLDGRGFDLARDPEWDLRPSPWNSRQSSRLWSSERGFWWDYIYHQPPAAVACLAGRIEGCREAVVAGGSGDESAGGPNGRVVTTERRFWQRESVIAGSRYLSDVAREVGHGRFMEFWNSTQPVETALAGALRRPVGEWTATWQQQLGPRIPLGPRVPFGHATLAVLFAAAAVAFVAVSVRRRQVLLLVFAVGAFPSALVAQGNRWERQVRTQLDRAVAALQRDAGAGGRGGAGRILGVGPLNTDESTAFAVSLDGGRSYDILAVCDDDCTSLHLRLTNASGSDMAVDRSGENLPRMRFTPSRSGAYRVAVAMAVCRMNPCWYGVALSVRQGQ